MKGVRVTTWTSVIFVFVFMSACASQGSRVKCDGRLEPINAPVAKQKPGSSASPSAAQPPRLTASPSLGSVSAKDRP